MLVTRSILRRRNNQGFSWYNDTTTDPQCFQMWGSRSHFLKRHRKVLIDDGGELRVWLQALSSLPPCILKVAPYCNWFLEQTCMCLYFEYPPSVGRRTCFSRDRRRCLSHTRRRSCSATLVSISSPPRVRNVACVAPRALQPSHSSPSPVDRRSLHAPWTDRLSLHGPRLDGPSVFSRSTWWIGRSTSDS